MTISVANLSAFRDDKLILKKINFSLLSKEALIIRGSNGIGKSTLLRILAGFKKPDIGNILWNSKKIFDNPEIHANYIQNIAWLGHSNALKPSLTLKENLNLYAKLYQTNLYETLKKLNLSHLADIPIQQLSSGQKRRTALARILLKPAEIWLLDEPTVGLDQENIQNLIKIFSSFQENGGIILVSTHTELPLMNAKILHLFPPSLQ